MKRALLLGVVLAFSALSPVAATTKVLVLPVPLTTLAPTINTNFSSGDEVSGLLTLPSAIYLIGTIETTSSPLVTSTPLGGSDGFITSLSTQGRRSWDLRIGTSGDDVATAGCVDALGNLWVTGASTIPASVAATSPALNRLTVWEVSATGALLNTFTKDLTDIDIPTSIVLKGTGFIVRGVSNKAGFPTFALTVNSLGAIGPVKNTVAKPLVTPPTLNASSAAYAWQTLISASPIKGVIGAPPHQSINYLLKNSLKDKVLKGAYSIVGAPLALQYQSGIGVVLLSQGSGSYFLTILHTK